MESLQALTVFFGWSTIINIGLLLMASVAMAFLRGAITDFHAKTFGLSEDELSPIYFQFLANYKLAVIVLNVVPYVALKIMA